MTDEQLEALVKALNAIANELVKLNGHLSTEALKKSIIGQ